MSTQKPKVLVIGKYYPPYQGGIEFVTELYARAISDISSVSVIASNHKKTYEIDYINGIEVHRLPLHALFKSQPISFDLPFRFRCDDYDVIHLHGPNPYAAAVLLLKYARSRRRAKIVVTHHMDIYGRPLLRALTLPFYTALMKRAAWVSVTSMKNAVASQDIPKEAKIVAVPLSIDPSSYNLSEESRADAREWRRQRYGNAPLIGFVGRHARYKGIDVLLHALLDLPNVRAVIAGDGEYRATWSQLAANLGLSERVDFIGHLSNAEKTRLLLAIDAFAFPSTEVTEAFGISQLEAMIHGATVVATNLPTGVTDVSIDGETAVLAVPGDPKSLANKIKMVLSDRLLAQKLQSRAKEHVLENYTHSQVMAKFAEFVSPLLRKN